MKKQSKILLSVALLAVILTAQAGAQTRKSGDYYEVYPAEVTTLNYMIAAAENELYMFANTIDNLVEYDKYGIMIPGLAESWTISPDGLVYTFKLRKGVQWFTWQAKPYAEVVAQDWVDSAKYIMTKGNASRTADVIYRVVKNGEAYFEGKISDFSQVGVKALDKYTLQYTLEKPVPYFMSMLTFVTFLPVNGKFLAETGTRFGLDHKSLLYNGAYLMTEFEPQVTRVLTRNEKYWDKKNVHIKRLVYRYNKESGALAPELFLRGEVSWAIVPSSIVETWMNDPAKKAQLRPRVTSTYTYFYGFNFNPKFAPEYEPENWKVAVNNLNFRKALFHAFDRRAAMLTSEPYNPDRRLQTTITPRGFVSAGGKDYVDMAGLAAFSRTESFNKARALEFKAKALGELSGKAKFPVKALMPYRADMTEWANRVQVVEQQLEGLLGKDFIDVIPVSFPATGFLNATRRAGNYAIQELNWGPDYADPETYTDPFMVGATGISYTWLNLATAYLEADGTGKYQNMVELAKKEVMDMKKRYELFAKAEAFLIGEAFVIPYACGGGGYEASKRDPYSSPYAPFGLSYLKYKGQVIFPKGLSTEEFQKLEDQWKKEREAALSKAK